MVPVFDHHIHMDTRNCSDYELMALAGISRVMVPCSPTHERRFSRQAYAGRFDKLLEFERSRAASFGIELYVALSVNSVDMGDHRSACEGIEEVEQRLGRQEVRAVGELALRRFGDEEVDIFERQLRLASARRHPVILEAPIEMAAFEQLLVLLEGAIARGLVLPRQVCIVDLNHAKLKLARRLGLGGYGVPVSPRFDGPFCLREKLDHREVLRLLEEFGPEGLMLNSGLHSGNADPLCLAKTVLRLELHGLDRRTLQALASDNAEKLFLSHANP